MTLASRRVVTGKVGATVVVLDNFTFTAGTELSGHTSDSGHAWTYQTGGLSVLNQGGTTVGRSAGVQATAVVNAAVADCTVIVQFYATGGAGDAGPCWRASDDSNYWLISNSSGQVYKRVAGSFTAVGSAFAAGSAGDLIAVTVSGTSHTVVRNGITVASFTDSFNQTATKHGLRMNASDLFDQFKVTVP